MDAFSTAASAYMLVKELYNYYNSWKDCPSDVAELRDELSWLSKVLQIVEKILHNAALDPDLVECAREAKVRCSGVMQELAVKLTFIRKEGTFDSTAHELRAQAKRLLYPFKKLTIKRLAGDVAECLEQLDHVINLLNLDNSLRVADLLKAQGDELKTLLGTVQNAIDDQAVAEQRNYTTLCAQGDSIHDSVNALRISAANAATQAEELRRDKEIIAWLSPPASKPVDIDEQEPGTNSWFLESDTYRSWQTDHQVPAVFIHGGMGCGKSVLFATIERDLRQTHQSANVLAYYFSGDSQENANLHGWLCFLIARLSPPAHMHPEVLALWKEQEDTLEQPKTKDLRTCALHLLSKLRTLCYVLVDALDEIPKGQPRSEVLTFLQDLSDTGSKFCRVLCTGRSHPTIKRALGKSDRFQMLGIPTDANRLDIERYVKNQIERSADLQSQSDAIKSRILSRLVGEDAAMFRLAVLQMRSLESLQPLIEDSIIDTLDTLPFTLEETYTKILKSINQHKSRRTIEYAQAALTWLTFTRSALSVDQLIDAIAVTVRPSWNWEEGRRQFRAENLLELLPDLVKISGDPAGASRGKQTGANADLRITFSHFSVKEYLLSDVPRDNPDGKIALSSHGANRSIAITCLAYLYMTNGREESINYYPLRSYAFDNWKVHMIKVVHEQYNGMSLMPDLSSVSLRKEFVNLASCAFFLTVDTIFKLPGIWNRDKTAETSDVMTRKSEALNIPFFRRDWVKVRTGWIGRLSGDNEHNAYTVGRAFVRNICVLIKWHDDTSPEPDSVSCLPLADGFRKYAWCEAYWLSGRSEYFLVVCRDSVECEFDLLRINISVSKSSMQVIPTINHTNAGSFQLSVSIDRTTLPKVLPPRSTAGPRHRICLSRTWRFVCLGDYFEACLHYYLRPRRRPHFVARASLSVRLHDRFRLLREAWERSDQQASGNEHGVIVSSRLMVSCQQCVDCYDMYQCWACMDCEHCTKCKDCTRCQVCTDCTDCTDCAHCTQNRDCADCVGCTASVGCTNCKNCRTCEDCKNCVSCTDCVGCDGLTGATGWWRNQDPAGMQLILYSPARHSN